MKQPSKDVSLIIKGKMESGNVSAVLRRHAPTIFHPVQRYALSLVRNVNSIVDVEVWIMGGVVLQGLVMLVLYNVQRNNIYVPQMYIMTE